MRTWTFLLSLGFTLGACGGGDEPTPIDASGPDAAAGEPDAPPATFCDEYCGFCGGGAGCADDCAAITVDCDEPGLDELSACLDVSETCGVMTSLCFDTSACFVQNLTCGNATCDPYDDVNCPADCGEPDCSHDECTEGTPLLAGCTACTELVCGADAYCCETAWDGTCVTAAIEQCGLCL
jgi:hypothetical protein